MSLLKNPVAFAIILLSMIIGSSVLTRGHEWGDDFASYIMQGQSIVNGSMDEFIQRNAFTIQESSFQIGPVAYPWGYPLFLTPALLLKGVHPLALKIPGLFFFSGFLVCFYLLIKERFNPITTWLLLSVFAFNPMLIKFLDQILSDIPFLFLITLGLLLISRLDDSKHSWRYFAVIGLCIFGAFFVRTTGVLLLASFMGFQAIRFFRKPTLRKNIVTNTIVSVLVFITLWLVSSLLFPNGQGSYLAQLKDLSYGVFVGNIRLYFYLFGSFFGDGKIWIFVYYVLVIFFLIGAWQNRLSDLHLIIFFVLYLFAMILWPEWQGPRFIFPLLPIFVYFVFQGTESVIQLLHGSYSGLFSILTRVFWLIVIGIFLFGSGTLAYSTLKDGRKISGPFDPFSMDVYNYIKTETRPNSVIVFHKPRAMRLFTGHDAVMITDCDRLTLGDYVVINKKAENSQIPPDEIGQCGITLTPVFENRRFIVYQLPK